MNLADLSAPEPLSTTHNLNGFDSGVSSLDEWLKKRALKNEHAAASRTYVSCDADKVAGYYCLSAGGIGRESAPRGMTRNMPDPIPVMILGRLAVDRAFHAQGMGTGLLRDAVLRTVQAAEIAGIRGILVHAISEDAKRFYEKYGFVASPAGPLTVMITVTEAMKIIARP